MNDPIGRTAPGTRARVDYSGRPEAAEADAIVEWIAWLMDGSIVLPGGWRFGLDPIIGLIPGVGDMIGAAASSVIVLQAHKAGLPKPTIMRMVANVAIDTALGAVPFVGDLFDFGFKVNQRNLQLYRAARAGTHQPGQDVVFLLALIAIISLILAAPIVLAAWLLSRFF